MKKFLTILILIIVPFAAKAAQAPIASGFSADGATILSSGNVLSAGVSTTTVLTSGSSQALAFPSSGSATYDITLTANCAITLTGGTSGQYQALTLIFRQNTIAGWTPALPAGIRWPGGVAPTPNIIASGIDVFILSTSDGGTTIFGNY